MHLFTLAWGVKLCAGGSVSKSAFWLNWLMVAVTDLSIILWLLTSVICILKCKVVNTNVVRMPASLHPQSAPCWCSASARSAITVITASAGAIPGPLEPDSVHENPKRFVSSRHFRGVPASTLTSPTRAQLIKILSTPCIRKQEALLPAFASLLVDSFATSISGFSLPEVTASAILDVRTKYSKKKTSHSASVLNVSLLNLAIGRLVLP